MYNIRHSTPLTFLGVAFRHLKIILNLPLRKNVSCFHLFVYLLLPVLTVLRWVYGPNFRASFLGNWYRENQHLLKSPSCGYRLYWTLYYVGSFCAAQVASINQNPYLFSCQPHFWLGSGIKYYFLCWYIKSLVH